jgi:hypothetical protein
MNESPLTSELGNVVPDIPTEAKKKIKIRKTDDGPWVVVTLRYRGTLWAHVDDGERKFRVLWKDVHPEDKFDFQ